VSAEPELPPDLLFRSAAAPGLDEDDVFAALMGLPGDGLLWGEALPPVPAEPDGWDEERERRRRHDALLRRWRPVHPPDARPPEA